ncbi:MAG: glycosyltransferase [Deltaproteobacteria bacterium]|nr:glycosyltransferase [Deltaproteobacteria bacterium]
METLALFVRQPQAKKTKTRLAKVIGEENTLRLYSAFLCDLAETCAQWAQQSVGVDPNRRLVLYAEPDVEDPVLAEIARRTGARTCSQVEGDLGERMRSCIEDEFNRGARSVCIIGSDSPHLMCHQLDHAFRALMWHHVVLGPSFDGGYWLVGSQRPAPDLFTDIPWSTSDVTRATLERCRNLGGAEPHLLPLSFDVDTAEDVQRLACHLFGTGTARHTWNAMLDMELIDDVGRVLFEVPTQEKPGGKSGKKAKGKRGAA